MSSHYRSQIKRVCEEAADVLSDQKIFQIPARPQGTPDNVFFISVQTRLKPLNDEMEDVGEVISELSCAADKWMNLRSSMTGAERAVDNPLYDTFITETNYHLVLSDLRKYFKTLRTQKRDLEAAIPAQAPRVPNPPPAAPLMHLPKAELPTFAGDCTTYTSFWNSFKIGVHDLSIPDSIKFTYLKQCLSGPPLALVNSLPISDLSYNSALDLLTKTYDNPDEIARALHNLLRKLPHVRGGDNFCIDLRSLIDQFESICIQMGQKNLEYDTVNFQMAIEERLPRFVLDEIFMAKESNDNWTIDLLKEKLRAILKRKEQIHSISPKIHSAPKSKPFPSFSNSSYSPSTNPSALTFHSQSNQKFNQSRTPPQPKLPCIFCSEMGHFSNKCTTFPDFHSRAEKLKSLHRCFKCLKEGHFSNRCPNPATCSKCNKQHPRALCKFSDQNSPNHTNFSQTFTPPINSINSPLPCSNNETPLPTFNRKFYPQLYPVSAVPSLPVTPTPLIPNATQNPNNEPSTDSDHNRQTNTSTITSPPKSVSKAPILLKCVRVTFFHPENRKNSRQGILLLDDASTNTYISLMEANSLNLPLTPNFVEIGVFNNPKSKPLPSFQTKFGIELINGQTIIVTANTVDHLTQPTPYIPFSPELLTDADLVFLDSAVRPVILLGSDYYYEVEPTPVSRLPSGYHLIQTLLGPIVAGKHFGNAISLPLLQQSNFCVQSPNPSIPADYFTLEGIGIKDQPDDTSVNDAIISQFNSDIQFTSNRYQVKLPFRADPSTLSLPSNFGLCYGRLRNVLNSLSKNPSQLKQYNEIINEQMKLGIIESVPSPYSFSSPLHYLAHHPVIHPSKQKIRIVYDGSAHCGKSPSLNDCLYPGPSILPDLIGLLIRFRLPKIAITADIEKAFLQVSVHPSHRDCTRFLWMNDIGLPLSHSNLKIFRFTRVSFGLSPSPFLLAATISHHLSVNPSPLSNEIQENIYVDNLLLSSNNPIEAQTKCLDSIELFAKASMPLREFCSNSNEALSLLPHINKLIGPDQKFLGIKWNTDSDCLILSHQPPSTFNPTKRAVLSFIAACYDPLGLISPVLVPLKLFFQSICKGNYNWDQPLPSNLTNQWQNLFKNWSSADSISVPRYQCFLPDLNRKYQLHCFVDASCLAMCTALYLRITHPSSQNSVIVLIFAKTKVKPMHKGQNLTIPRLELIAAEMGVRALKFVKPQLLNISLDQEIFLWSDSSTVLHWLNSNPSPKEIFVTNRLNIIRQFPNLIVRHLPGSDNPSDLGTRGVPSFSSLKTHSIWWEGPEWLSKTTCYWPHTNEINPFHSNNYGTIPISTNLSVYTLCTITHTKNSHVFDLTCFSRLPKLLRIVSYCNRFLSLTRQKINNQMTKNYQNLCISLQEIRSSLILLLKHEQTALPPNDDHVNAFGLYLDENGIYRAKGRLLHSQLSKLTIEPFFLPTNSHLTLLIIYETHLLNHHSSPLHTLSIVRRQFWVPKGRRVTERAISKCCIVCRRFSVRAFDLPAFPPLPKERVNFSPPFSSVGLDFCGPIHIFSNVNEPKPRKNARIPIVKYWILVWVCLITRGISLDLVSDQSAQTFLLSFRRFCAKYGYPNSIFSDHAPTFVSFKNFIQHTNPIQWNLRVPFAPWRGGHYERLMALIKHHLRRTFSNRSARSISLQCLNTAIIEIESVINSRPITFLSNNPSNPLPLRPIDFVRPFGYAQNFVTSSLEVELSDSTYKSNQSNQKILTEMWDATSALTKIFYSKWKWEYLLSLREKDKKSKPPTQRCPQIGELVLVHVPETPRSLWSVAKILEIYKNELNYPDTARLKFISGHITTRSISHLFPLETVDEINYRSTKSEEDTKNPSQINEIPETQKPKIKWNWAKKPPIKSSLLHKPKTKINWAHKAPTTKAISDLRSDKYNILTEKPHLNTFAH